MRQRDDNCNYIHEDHPTMRQIQYLTTLEEIGNRRGIIAEIARRCNVNNASVSRFLKSCSEDGLLDEDYCLTDKGTSWLEGYKNIIDRLNHYFENTGLNAEECYNAVRELVENVDISIISGMLKNRENPGKGNGTGVAGEGLTGEFLRKVLPARINTDISFMIYRINPDRPVPSMADRGFLKPATLKHNSRGSNIILTMRELTAESRITGSLMRGQLDTLKYVHDGRLVKADMYGDRIKIPLSACHIEKSTGGELRGMIEIMITCSVGRIHMPESSAVLVFWM